MKRAQINRDLIINNIITYAKEKNKNKDPVFLEFIKLMYRTYPLDNLSNRETNNLYNIALALWGIVKKHKKNQETCKIFSAESQKKSWKSDYMFVAIATKSKPFLIDSIKLALNRAGCTINNYTSIADVEPIRNKNKITELKTSNIDLENAEAYTLYEINYINNANIENLEKTILAVLDELTNAVNDWHSMQTEMQKAIDEFRIINNNLNQEEINESIEFMQWLITYFTFLGYSEHIKIQDSKKLVMKKNSNLGILKTNQQNYKIPTNLDIKVRSNIKSNKTIIITKTNQLSNIHRPPYMDMIIVKSAKGEKRFIGLFTSDAYDSNPEKIPFLRKKINNVLEQAKSSTSQYEQKKLSHILKRLPRDELFQASLEELQDMSIGILGLQDRRVIKLFARNDICNRFISCLVYLPKDNYSTALRIQIQKLLIEEFHGNEITSAPIFSENTLISVHFIIRKEENLKSTFDLDVIENKIISLARSWLDLFQEKLIQKVGPIKGIELFEKYKMAFPAEFRSLYSGDKGEKVALIADQLNNNNSIQVELTEGLKEEVLLRIYQLNKLINLSDAIPILENMGLKVIEERLFEIQKSTTEIIYLSEFVIQHNNIQSILKTNIKDNFYEATIRIWQNKSENDRFNVLVLNSGLDWKAIKVIRAYAKYLKQIGFSLSESSIQDTFEACPELAREIINLFVYKFNPKLISKNKFIKTKRHINQILKQLDAIDQERIAKSYVEIIEATVRTNVFKTKPQSQAISFKIESNKIIDMPLPKPMFEVFVFSDRVEGVHLRAGKVSRGGIRWSDRRDDFRTEVLGLMKAQNGKNSLIVPAGSKGGFITKKFTPTMSKEKIEQEAIYCYKQFISALLDLTDNLINNNATHPEDIVCYDDFDPYLVVAADRGTATFSDIANQISKDYDFWLMDAFASGGSAGYDHKKIGITARGAWSSVEWHFKSLNIDITQPFSVIGIGGMAGDVFGNGMLLSEQIKLIAAFDHSYIFIDPNPNPQQSFQERSRLFKIKNSSWLNYDDNLISKGGGVYKRTDKYIEISPEAKKTLSLSNNKYKPDDLIKAILSAKADLLWNGGIGTYIKSKNETDLQVRDHANDSLRINANKLNCKVIAEGGNLGFTQLGRIEAELNNITLNTDFIDNSAGVDCSDHEVNIKIYLNNLVKNNILSYENRNILLKKMTNDVANMVLENTIHQNIFLSIEMLSLPKYIYLYEKFIENASRIGILNPKVEYLPSSQVVLERISTGKSLTRPEMAVLLSYSKIILQMELLNTSIVNDPNNLEFLLKSFPRVMLDAFNNKNLNNKNHIWQHPLRKEIIATHLSNTFIHEMGISFIPEINQETSKSVIEIITAYITIRKIFDIDAIMKELCDNYRNLNANHLLYIYNNIRVILRKSVKWLLRNNFNFVELENQAEFNKLSKNINTVLKNIPLIINGKDAIEYKKFLQNIRESSLNNNIINKISLLYLGYDALNIAHAAQEFDQDLFKFTELYFMLSEKTKISWLQNLIVKLTIETRWDISASYILKGKLEEIQRLIIINAFKTSYKQLKNNNIETVINIWTEKNSNILGNWSTNIADFSKRNKVGFTVLFTLINELDRVTILLKDQEQQEQ